MTIGPLPSTRILWRSSLRGNEALQELVEEAEAVVRPRPRLGVVLHAAGRDVERPDALDRAVVEVDVGELDGADLRLDPLAGLARDREAVVLRGDGDPAGAQVLDRVVGAAVAERQLERLQPRGAREQLVAEADAEHRLVLQKYADRVHDVSKRRRVTRTRHEEEPVRVGGQQLPGARGARVEL